MIINKAYTRETTQITVCKRNEILGLGDINYSFGEDVSLDKVNGWYSFKFDEYQLYLNLSIGFLRQSHTG